RVTPAPRPGCAEPPSPAPAFPRVSGKDLSIREGKERTMKRLAATAATVAALLVTSTATATAATGSPEIEPGEHAFVDVTAATLWVEPRSEERREGKEGRRRGARDDNE